MVSELGVRSCVGNDRVDSACDEQMAKGLLHRMAQPHRNRAHPGSGHRVSDDASAAIELTDERHIHPELFQEQTKCPVDPGGRRP